MLKALKEAIEERVLVCDGAMGTMLYAKGVFINKSFDALNVTQPDLVAEVHAEYVRAGADIIETNTFGANRIKLGSFGIADKLHAINEQGARIARHAADDRAYVAGAIGPLGIRIEPWGKTGVDEARDYFREQAQALADGGVDLFILETFRDLNEMGAAIDAVRAVSDLPIVAQMTTEEDGNTLDGTPPEKFAPELERRGATLIGVNCAVGPVPRDQKSRLARSIANRRFVIGVELLPPRGYQTDQVVERARRLKFGGVDVISIPDGQRGGARMSALSLAVLVEQQAGVETLLHYACRDRNLLGIQSDLLGAHAMGVRNLMLVTGDPGRVGDYPDATAVFDVDSIGLTNVVVRLNRGCDVGGQPIGAPTAFHIGVSINPAATNLDQELRRFEYKVDAGAEFIVTRPVFDVRAFEPLLRRLDPAGLPVIAGLFPFESARNAEFMANEVPGVRVPDALLERMRKSDGRSGGAAERVGIAREIASELRSAVQGFQVSTQSGDVESALSVLDGLR